MRSAGAPSTLRRTLAAAEQLDVIQARASFSRLVAGVEPKLATDARIELPEARHPLLIPAVRARTGDARPPAEEDSRPAGPVPVDLQIAPPVSALIVTGPNTGGKTVALKTVGLLVLMAQAGLHVPAGAGSSLPVLKSRVRGHRRRAVDRRQPVDVFGDTSRTS